MTYKMQWVLEMPAHPIDNTVSLRAAGANLFPVGTLTSALPAEVGAVFVI